MLGDSDWWWNVALDGVVGAIIGGLVTLAVLGLTVRHERHRSVAQRVEDQSLALLQRSQRLSRRLSRLAVDDVQERRELVIEIRDDWMLEATMLVRRSSKHYPRLSELVQACSSMLQALESDPAILGTPHGGVVMADGINMVESVLQGTVVQAGYWERAPYARELVEMFNNIREDVVTARNHPGEFGPPQPTDSGKMRRRDDD